jgi:hypothetical protein
MQPPFLFDEKISGNWAADVQAKVPVLPDCSKKRHKRAIKN